MDNTRPTQGEIAAYLFVHHALEPLALRHIGLMEAQLVDSTVVTTRVFWRKRAGHSDDIANDPRPLREILTAG